MKNPKIKIAILLVLPLFVFTNNADAQETIEETPIKINTVLLNVPFIASDRNGRNIAGLTKENFSVFQGGEKQTIEFFANAEAPINVAIVIDTSGSTTNVLSDIKKAARNFITILGSEDKAMIVSFDFNVNRLNQLTSNQKELRGAINSASKDDPNGSNMYDAIYQILTKDFASVKGRKAIIVLTDGDVHGRKVSKEKFFDALVESDTLVYPIFYQTTQLLPTKVKTITMEELVRITPVDFLNRVAVTTGGRLYAANANDFNTAFQKIADELKKQYVLGFYPANTEGGKSAPIKIEVDRKDVIVRTKRTIRLKTLKPENK